MTVILTPAEFVGEMAAFATAVESAPLRPAMEDARVKLRQNVRDNFTSSAGPDGQAWPPRKVPGDGHPLLMDTGALLQAATGGGAGAVSTIEDRAVEIGVDPSVRQGGIPGAGRHEFGGGGIPARPYLGASDATLDAIGEVLADAALDAMLAASPGG